MNRRSPRHSVGSRMRWGLAAVVIVSGCQNAARPCESAEACSLREECLANRCTPVGHFAVPPHSTRFLTVPDAMAVLVNDKPLRSLPPVVTLGRAGQTQRLLLRFPAAWDNAVVEAAFLVFEPRPASAPSHAEVLLEVSLADNDWTSSTLHQHIPSTSGPSTREVARTGTTLPLRFDVTALVQARTGVHRSFSVVAASEAALGGTYGLGWPDSDLPRLEVYVLTAAATTEQTKGAK